MKFEVFKDDIDNVTKYVFFDNCGVIEISHIIHDNQPDRDVFCVPSHYYCNLGCRMCHLTDENIDKPMNKIKYNRLLECLDVVMSKINKKNKMLISFMGVGEPLLNLDLLEEICDTEFDYNKYTYLGQHSIRKVTVSRKYSHGWSSRYSYEYIKEYGEFKNKHCFVKNNYYKSLTVSKPKLCEDLGMDDEFEIKLEKFKSFSRKERDYYEYEN